MRSLVLAATLIACGVRAGGAQRVPVSMRTAVGETRFGDTTGTRRGSPLDGIRDIKVAPNGVMFVLAQRKVLVIENGKLVRTFNGKSGSQDAFVDPVELEAANNNVTVRDLGRREVLTYDVRGVLLARQHMPRRDDPLVRIAMRGGSTLIEASPVASSGLQSGRAGPELMRAVSAQGAKGAAQVLFRIRIDSLYFRAAYDSGGNVSRDQNVVMSMPVPRATRFGASGAWARSGDSLIAHADGVTGVITWYRFDASGASIADMGRLGREPRPVTPEDVTEEEERLQRLVRSATTGSSGNAVPSFPPQLYGVPSSWSIATRALFGNDGTLWVGVNRIYTDVRGDFFARVGDENTWTVFPPPHKGPAYTVSLRPLFRLTAVVDDRLYGFFDDGVTAPAVEVYTVKSP